MSEGISLAGGLVGEGAGEVGAGKKSPEVGVFHFTVHMAGII